MWPWGPSAPVLLPIRPAGTHAQSHNALVAILEIKLLYTELFELVNYALIIWRFLKKTHINAGFQCAISSNESFTTSWKRGSAWATFEHSGQILCVILVFF